MKNTDTVNLLIEKNLIISAAESCTGGMFTAYIADVPGASSVLHESIVTYSNSAKMKYLGVKKETIGKYTEVSRETAAEMARGIAENTGADIGVSITGIAGPGGGTEQSPVGTVFEGVYYNGSVNVCEFHFEGDRNEVRKKACEAAFDMVYCTIKGTV